MWIPLHIFLGIHVLCVSGTAISHVDSIFEIFSARSLIRFFEFNSSSWNLTNTCARHVFQYLEALQKDQLWAVKSEYTQFEFNHIPTNTLSGFFSFYTQTLRAHDYINVQC